jgi:hypothetical protein
VSLVPHPWSRGFAWEPPRGPFRRITEEQEAHYDEHGYRAGSLVPMSSRSVDAAVRCAGDPHRPAPDRREPVASLPDAEQWRLAL